MAKKRFDREGSVISGTMRPQDTLPAFVGELQNVVDELGALPTYRVQYERELKDARKLLAEVEERMEQPGYYKSEEGEAAYWDIEAVCDALFDLGPRGPVLRGAPG